MSQGFGSTSGKWSAFVEPLTSRRQIFHLVKEEPSRAEPGEDGKTRHIQRASYEIELVLHKLEREGEWGPAPPTMTSHFDGGELADFFRVIVNEAAKEGIFADGYQDSTREIRTLTAHLEDMRKLVFKGHGYEKL